MKKRVFLPLLLIVAMLFLQGCDEYSMGIAKLKENEVGVLLNNITGKMEVITDVGTQIFIPFIYSFYTLDKREQTLEMTANPATGSRFAKDDIKIKTIDGSDVYVDMTVQYKIIPAMAEVVLMDSGPGDAYKYKWIRDYTRSIARLEFGELTTEEFYNATKRTQKAIEVKKTLNEMLQPHGIEVTNIIPQNFRFYAEYEKKIKEKKAADQEVDKQKSKAQAAKENQKRKLIDIQREITIALTKFEGEQKQRIIKVKGEAKKAKLNADAYYYQKTVGADAEYYRLKQKAEAILAEKKASAEGIKSLAKALEGKGGKYIILREYVKHLKDMDISVKPYTINSLIRKINVSGDEEDISSLKGGGK